MKWTWIFILPIALFSCKKDYTDLDVDVFGHAGESLLDNRSVYPPNTQESAQFAIELGAQGFEIDVQMTADYELVVYHDEFLEDNSTGTGCINDLLWQDVQDIEVYDSEYGIEKLNAYLELAAEQNVKIMLDIKHYNACTESFIDFQKLDSSLNAQMFALTPTQKQNVWVNSRNVQLLDALSDTNVLKSFEYDDIPEAIQIAKNNDFDALLIKLDNVDAESIAELKDAYPLVGIYQLYSKAHVRKALSYAPDFVISDQLSYTLNLTDE